MSAPRPAPDLLADAAERLAAGGLVAFPTETVWGLGADASSSAAVGRLLAWKGREATQPISVLIDDEAALAELGIELSSLARRLAAAFWPGPLTLVLPCPRALAPGVARADGAVGVRCSPNPLARALARRLREAGLGPLTATSLNRHGQPPARTLEEARALCGDGSELGEPVLLTADGPDAGGGPPSSVVDVTGARAVVLRHGALGPDVLDRWLEEERA